MQIHTHSPSRPWEQGLSSPPPKTTDKPTGHREPVDSFKASDKEKSHFSMLGTGLLALTALTGLVAAQPAAAQEVQVQNPQSQEVTPDSLARDGYQNPDDWKEDLHGGYQNHCAALPRPGLSQRFEGLLKFEGPDAWKADLGGGDTKATSPNNSRQRTFNPVQTQGRKRGEYENPDDWKEDIHGGGYSTSRTDRGSDKASNYQGPDDWKSELGGGDYRPGPSGPKKSRGKQKRQPVEKSERYEGPDSWKEEIGGGGSYDYDSGSDSGSTQSDDWGGPDDWKGGL